MITSDAARQVSKVFLFFLFPAAIGGYGIMQAAITGNPPLPPFYSETSVFS